MAKKILVTGGAGFLGSHLCAELLARGHSVVCLDNFSSGRYENVAPLKAEARFALLEHDICNPLLIEVDEIYNLACPASPSRYQNDPIKTTKTSVLGAIHLLSLAQKKGIKILQASTSEVYGDPIEHPQRESYWGHVNPIGIRACYDEGKRCAETLFFDYHREYGLPIKVARIFNTYGPLMDPHDGRVVSNFISQALQNKPITIYGTGRQTRSFCYISDLVNGLIELMESDSSCTGPINLGNPAEFSILELAQEVLRLTQSSSEIIFLPLPSDDPRQRRPDITAAKKILGWEPCISLKEGLGETIRYFEKIFATV